MHSPLVPSPVGLKTDVCQIEIMVSHVLMLFRLSLATILYIKTINRNYYINNAMIGQEIQYSLGANYSVGLRASDLVSHYKNSLLLLEINIVQKEQG